MDSKHPPHPLPTARALGPGPRSRVRRNPARAAYDQGTVHAIIDEALICHVAVVLDGEPLVLPTAHARAGNVVYLHGAIGNRLLGHVGQGLRCCLSFTLVDGLVLARSAFHHSMNHRSVVAFGAARHVHDEAEKAMALARLVDHGLPGRSAETRPPSEAELRKTQVVRVEIEEASAKVRTGPPVDDAEDMGRPNTWAGVVPLQIRGLHPVRDGLLPAEVPVPLSFKHIAKRFRGEQPLESVEPPFVFSSDKSRLDVDLIHRFLSEDSYWARGISRSKVERTIECSVCLGLYEGPTQIGYARVVHDGARFAYLADVFIVPSYRGIGLGQRLVRFALDHPELEGMSRVLLGTQDAHAFYARFDFVTAPEGRYMLRFGDSP